MKFITVSGIFIKGWLKMKVPCTHLKKLKYPQNQSEYINKYNI